MSNAPMPLLEAMLKYAQEQVYPLHTPGHKGGRGMAPQLCEQLGPSVVMDVSLMSELDDIHEPETYIKAAQDRAAAVYGSDKCFWAVNGTSQAIQAMLMTALSPGDKLLLPRNAHRSVAGGLILGGIEATYIAPEYLSAFGIHSQVTPKAIEEALDKDPAIKAVLVTSPNYYGIAADLKTIAGLCHKRRVVLLVDEAHGPHLGFSKLLPASALASGADACAQSTHKILGAMTQCSMLHVQGARLDLQRAADVMSILTTTSPNYLLMASLDAARAQVEAKGESMAEAALKAAEALRQILKSFAGLRVLEAEDCGKLALDRTKVTVNVSGWGYTGIQVGEALRQAGIAVELVDSCNVLFLVTYADAHEDFSLALEKIKGVFQRLEAARGSEASQPRPEPMPVTSSALGLRQVFYAPKKSIPLEAAIGEICGEQVSFYPPGIPVLLPGELITREIITYCQYMKGLGLPVSGPADSSLEKLRIVRRVD